MPERYISPHQKPSPYEREILGILQEECAEIIVQVSKALRFGLEDSPPGETETNREAIGREIGDLDVVVELARENGLFSTDKRFEAYPRKIQKLAQFMQHRLPEDAPDLDSD